MEIDGFRELLDMVYIAKTLHDMGKFELVTKSFGDTLEYDNYYNDIYDLIGNLFEHIDVKHYEHRNLELNVLSDNVIVDFYTLAGEYGKLNGVSDSDNGYIKSAQDEVNIQLDICHCLDWILAAHTEPKRPFHSRLGLIISHDCGCLDRGVLALRLIEIHKWFEEQCNELREKIAAFKPLSPSIHPERMAIAA